MIGRSDLIVKSLRQSERHPVVITCDIHSWMTAYWVVLDHPYVAVTNAKGQFEIVDLPEGEHEVCVWHENAGYLEKAYKITVTAGINKLKPITVSADRFIQ